MRTASGNSGFEERALAEECRISVRERDLTYSLGFCILYYITYYKSYHMMVYILYILLYILLNIVVFRETCRCVNNIYIPEACCRIKGNISRTRETCFRIRETCCRIWDRHCETSRALAAAAVPRACHVRLNVNMFVGHEKLFPGYGNIFPRYQHQTETKYK